MNEKIIETKELVHNYKVETRRSVEINKIQVLKGIDFAVEKGEFVGVMGKSGCGKTTFLKLLGMLERPAGGTVIFQGMDTEELWKDELADIRRRQIGFVFQDFYLMDSLSVMDNIKLPMILDKADPEVMKKKVEKLSEQFGIADLLYKAPYELSGGEKQRTAICRALINDPEIVLADEPTGNLDSKSGQVVIDALCKINDELGKTVVMVTHDSRLASYCKKIILLKDGEIVDTIERKDSREDFYHQILDKTTEL
ncbi:ABC transporter ATP-binding protein [Lachnospiraceae bacterium]|uniref:ABC transporter ATP-binding protein n=1 Tax=Extibacter sp. GGCC_0201 TaxID=2731209 RepID=UPI001AA129B1|nr:ABC transporter ATP-binding protein [Extibacter sp. GGCC_0201]MBO1719684.1 ABC transporter ATP-binding protein [Extibacter sp. GGCC_0201]BDF33820.1 ABC transporter ATP-binding protein [Lachnospiraceae bacterium]BDF37825.1 ABC transporter ATP-binding protein [Lachnospiraceae bacterium]